MTPDDFIRKWEPLAIAQAAHRLNEQRKNWLNPPTWVERVPEVVPCYPDLLADPRSLVCLAAKANRIKLGSTNFCPSG